MTRRPCIDEPVQKLSPIGDTCVHILEALCHRYHRLIQRILQTGHASCFLKLWLTWLLCEAAVQTVVLSVHSVTYDCSWLCWTCMHTVFALTAFFCALPKASQTKALGLLSKLWTFSVVTRFISSQDVQHYAVVRPLTCSACLTGSVRGLRRQKWHSSSAMPGITILTPSMTCGVLDCCSSLSSKAWANFPMSIKLPCKMGLRCCLPASCVARPDTQNGTTR